MRRITFEFPDGFQPNAVWLNYVMQSENSGEMMIGIRSLDTKEICALRDGATIIEIDRKEGVCCNDQSEYCADFWEERCKKWEAIDG